MELIRQVSLFVVESNKLVGMEAVLKFMKPFLMFSVLRKTSLGFARELISSMTSLACSLPSEATGILKLLTESSKYCSRSNDEEVQFLLIFAEYLIDAYVVVLKQMACSKMPTTDAQRCSVELLKSLFSLCLDQYKPLGVGDFVLRLAKRLLVAQRGLGLYYLPELLEVFVFVSLILSQMEFEHEQLTSLKLLNFLVEWKTETLYDTNRSSCYLSEELLCVFPVISLTMSTSKSVKVAAGHFLLRAQELLLGLSASPYRAEIYDTGLLSISTPASILSRLLKHQWFEQQFSSQSLFFMDFFIRNGVPESKGKSEEAKYWTFQLREYLSNFGRQKYTFDGISGLVSSVLSILIIHSSLGSSAVESLTALGVAGPKMGMPLFLIVLFYSKILCNNETNSPEMLLRLLESLPSIASHSAMLPLIMQTILPMVQKEAKPVLYAIGVRLLCKIWMVTDWAFATLQGVLELKTSPRLISEREISLSIAASLRDVCKHNPDRGVDLILSISSCIEGQDSIVQALGLESLSHLCEADVVDFYTAWNFVSKHLLDYSTDPAVAHSLCTLLRWGAMDAEAYSEASKPVIETLWHVATSRKHNSESLWAKARAAAFKSLSHYKVLLIQDTIPGVRRENFECLVYEENPEILQAMECLDVEIIKYEHTTRRRGVKDKRTMVHKFEKVLHAFPQVIFSAEKLKHHELPGAALLSLDFTPKDLINHGTSENLRKIHDAYEKGLVEIAESLYISRNILVAVLVLQSWKPFIHHWMRAADMLVDDKQSSSVLDKSSKAANDILKIMGKVAEKSIPRISVSISLAIGALCSVVPPSAHLVISAASDLLFKWLFEYEHEHRQWSAAISLGLMHDCFHPTDKKQKFKVINGLLKVICNSQSFLVRGACGLGLGYACQSVCDRVEVAGDSCQEGSIIENIVGTLCALIIQLYPNTSDAFKNLKDCFPLDGQVDISNVTQERYGDLEIDAWGVAGLVLGLGSSIFALYDLGAYEAVIAIKNILISWIPDVDSPVHSSTSVDEITAVPLYMGSCLALPTVVTFCQKVELLDDDLHALFNRYISLVSQLLSLKKTGALWQNLLMATCIGAGCLLSYIINDGVHFLRRTDVENLLGTLRHIYTNPYPPFVHFGAFFGVVNAFGAGAGDLTHVHPQLLTLQINNEKDTSFVRAPLFLSPSWESLSASMIHEMFMVAKISKDQQLRHFAAWALSFLRNQWLSKDPDRSNDSQNNSAGSTPSYHSFSEDTLVWNLSVWLRDINFIETGETVHAETVVTVLRCLSKAPRLPAFDWGAIIRRCMRYQAQTSVKLATEMTSKSLREECVCFSLAHAGHISPLLHFLDDLMDLPRFRALEIHLQSKLLRHLSYLLKLFSGSRLDRFYEDIIDYFSSSNSPYLSYTLEQKSILRASLWKGLHQCLSEGSEQCGDSSQMENCMECLLHLLPMVTSDSEQPEIVDEWSDATRCLALARNSWLMDILQVHVTNSCHEGSNFPAGKKIVLKARLVKSGCLSASVLGTVKAYMLNRRTKGIWWRVLVEVAAAVSTTENNIKQQWLLDALEVCYITEYPSTALRFVGLLSGSSCQYMPLLIMNPTSVLSDLPVTLPSILSSNTWSSIRHSLLDKLWSSANRICSWAEQLTNGNVFSSHGIHDSEAELSGFLGCVMHWTCVAVKDYLPFDKQLRLANFELEG